MNSVSKINQIAENKLHELKLTKSLTSIPKSNSSSSKAFITTTTPSITNIQKLIQKEYKYSSPDSSLLDKIEQHDSNLEDITLNLQNINNQLEWSSNFKEEDNWTLVSSKYKRKSSAIHQENALKQQKQKQNNEKNFVNDNNLIHTNLLKNNNIIINNKKNITNDISIKKSVINIENQININNTISKNISSNQLFLKEDNKNLSNNNISKTKSNISITNDNENSIVDNYFKHNIDKNYNNNKHILNDTIEKSNTDININLKSNNNENNKNNFNKNNNEIK